MGLDVNEKRLRDHKDAYEAHKRNDARRSAQVLHEDYGLTIAEIAFIMDKTESTIRYFIEVNNED